MGLGDGATCLLTSPLEHSQGLKKGPWLKGRPFTKQSGSQAPTSLASAQTGPSATHEICRWEISYHTFRKHVPVLKPFYISGPLNKGELAEVYSCYRPQNFHPFRGKSLPLVAKIAAVKTARCLLKTSIAGSNPPAESTSKVLNQTQRRLEAS